MVFPRKALTSSSLNLTGFRVFAQVRIGALSPEAPRQAASWQSKAGCVKFMVMSMHEHVAYCPFGEGTRLWGMSCICEHWGSLFCFRGPGKVSSTASFSCPLQIAVGEPRLCHGPSEQMEEGKKSRVSLAQWESPGQGPGLEPGTAIDSIWDFV